MKRGVRSLLLFLTYAASSVAWAGGPIPDLNQQVKIRGLGREYFFGHNIPISTSQAAFVAAVNQEHLSGGGTVHVLSDTPISSAVTVPSDVRVVVEHGAKLLHQTGGSITFNGPFEAGQYKVFSGFDAGDVLFVGSAVPSVEVTWFGASPAATATVNDVAINSAILSANDVTATHAKAVKFGPGSYQYTHIDVGTESTVVSGVLLQGAGRNATWLVHSPADSGTDGVVFYYAGEGYAWFNGAKDIGFSGGVRTRRLVSVIHQHSFVLSNAILTGGDTAADSPATGIYYDYLVNADFEHLNIQNFALADADGALKSAAVFGAASATTSTEFRACYFSGNLRGFRIAGGSVTLDHVTMDAHADIHIVLTDYDDGPASLIINKSHFEGGYNGTIRFGDSVNAEALGAYVQSSGNAYLVGDHTPTAQVDVGNVGRFKSDRDSFSGPLFVRAHRGGGTGFAERIHVERLNSAWYYPDVVPAIQDDAGAMPGASGWRNRVAFAGHAAIGNGDIRRESSVNWTDAGPWAPVMTDIEVLRVWLASNITVGRPVAGDGSTPAAAIPHGRPIRFVFVQDAAAQHTVAFDSTYYQLAQSIPSSGNTESGQTLTIDFTYDLDLGKWRQSGAIVGWNATATTSSATSFAASNTAGQDAFTSVTGAYWRFGTGNLEYVYSGSNQLHFPSVLDIRNGAFFSGALSHPSSGNAFLTPTSGGNTAMMGEAPNTAGNVGVILGNVGAMTTEGTNLVEVRSFVNPRMQIDHAGQIRLGIGATACETCDATAGGKICYFGGVAGVKDTAAICAKDAGDAYAWRTIY